MSGTHATHGVGLTVVPSASTDLSSPIRDAHDVAAAFLAGYGPATRDCYARDLRQFGVFLADHGELDPLDVRRVHIDAYVRSQEEAGVAPATLGRRLSALSGFYAYAVDEALIDRSPVARVLRPRVGDESPRSGLDREEVRRLLAVADVSSARDRALATLLVLSGVRVSEAVGADVADLDHERGHRTLRVRRKGGRVQRLALAPRTAAAIDGLLGGRTDGPVFATSSGQRMDRFAAAKMVARLGRQAGIAPRISPHALRHTFVTLSLDAGVALHVVQDGCGHSSPTTTRRYDSNRDALDKAATHTLASYLAP